VLCVLYFGSPQWTLLATFFYCHQQKCWRFFKRSARAFINQQFYVPLSIQNQLVTTSNPKQKSTKFGKTVDWMEKSNSREGKSVNRWRQSPDSLGFCYGQALLPGAHDHEPEHGRRLCEHKRLAQGKDLVLMAWE
jgi:hypothetical protein